MGFDLEVRTELVSVFKFADAACFVCTSLRMVGATENAFLLPTQELVIVSMILYV